MNEEQEKTLPLAIKINNENGIATLKVFDKLLPMAQTMIEENSRWLNIDDDETYKWCKEERTKLNKYRDMVKAYRLDCMRNFFGEFESQCKQLEKLFDNASKKHSDSLKGWDEAKTAETAKTDTSANPPMFRITIVSLDEEAIKKVAKYAEKYGCKIVG